MEIFVCVGANEAQERRIRNIADGCRVYFHDEPPEGESAREEFLRCEIAFGNPPPSWIETSRKIDWVQLGSVGFDEYIPLADSVAAGRLSFSNLAGFFAEPVAESCLAGILALLRGVDRFSVLQTKQSWKGEETRRGLRMLAGASVVLLGYGSINKRFEELIVPFGCTIERFRSGWAEPELGAALSAADVVACAVPDTPATRRLFDRRRLALLPKTVIIANFGRGTLFDEEALCDALAEGRIAGAVIDVTEEEPLPPGHPLWNSPNTILTQHSGGGSADEIDRKIDVFEANLARYRSGALPADLADFHRGY